MTANETIHVLLADDHDIVRTGMKAALRAHPEFNVVGEARDGQEALLVTPGDPSALEAGVRRLLDNAALAKSLGERGALRAREYDWDTVAQKVLGVYRELTG